MGIALAVLALYLSMLLLPLHHAAALQHDLGKLGFEAISSWSICTASADDDDAPAAPAAVAKCPATGIGKQDFAATPPAAALFELSMVVAVGAWAAAPVHFARTMPRHVGQSRAPPVPV